MQQAECKNMNASQDVHCKKYLLRLLRWQSGQIDLLSSGIRHEGTTIPAPRGRNARSRLRDVIFGRIT